MDRHVEVPLASVADCAIRFLLIFVVIGGAWFFVNKLKPAEERVVTQDELVTSLNQDDDEAFQEILRYADTNQLDQLLDHPVGTNMSADQHCALIRKRIAVTQSLAKTRTLTRRIDALTKELELRCELAAVQLENDLVDKVANKELMDMARLYTSVQFEESSEGLNRQAIVGEITSSLVEFVDEGTDAKEEATITALLGSFDTLKGSFVNGSFTETKITELSQLVKDKLNSADRSTKIVEVIGSLMDEFHDSTRATRIAKLANMDCKTFTASVLDYLGSENGYVDPYVVKFQDAFNDVIELDDFGSGEYELVLEKIEKIAESGWNVAASEMLATANEKIDVDSLDEETQAKTRLFESRLSAVGDTFSLDGFTTLNDKPARPRRPTAAVQLIFFMSLERFQESKAKLDSLIKLVVRSQVPTVRLNIAMVAVHDNDKMNGMAAVEETAKRLSGMDWWQLNVSSPQYEGYEDVISVDNVPAILILDSSQRIVAVNPKPIYIRKLFSILK